MLPGCHVPRAQRGLHTEHGTDKAHEAQDWWRYAVGKWVTNTRDWNVHILSDDKIILLVSFFCYYSLVVASIGRA